MSNFSRGFLCGIGIGFIIAPIRGQEMRHLVSERVHALRDALPKSIQLPQDGQEISDHMTTRSRTFKERPGQGSTHAKKTTSREAKVTSLVRSRKTQVEMLAAESSPPHQAVPVPPFSPVPSSQETNIAGEPSVSNDSLRTIPGMEPEVLRELEEQGIDTISQLLAQTTTKESRSALAQKATLTTHQLKTLVDRADLLRLRGVGGDGATLLEEAGVTGCKDLQQRNPEHLYAILLERPESGLAATPLPTLDQLTQWIAQAKTLETQ